MTHDERQKKLLEIYEQNVQNNNANHIDAFKKV